MENLTQGIGPLDSAWRQKNAGNESDLILQLAFQQKWDFAVDFAVYVYCMLKDDEVMKTRLVVSACFVSEGHDMTVFFSSIRIHNGVRIW